MKQLLLACVLLALCAPAALAGGFNLSWGNACWSDPGHANFKSFTCNTNVGSAVMTCSFSLDYDQSSWLGVNVDIIGAASASVLPDWWLLYTCRGALTSTCDFSTAPKIGCKDPWVGRGAGGDIYLEYPSPGFVDDPNRALLRMSFAIPDPDTLRAGIEYYACQARITYSKTVGTEYTEACAGCGVPMVWAVTRVESAEVQGNDVITEPLPGGNQCLWWQTCFESGDCHCAVVPSRNQTWGQIKSLYR